MPVEHRGLSLAYENSYIRDSTTSCNTQIDIAETPDLPHRNPTRDRPCPPRRVNPQIGFTPIATQTLDPTVELLLHQMRQQQLEAQRQQQATWALQTLSTRHITVSALQLKRISTLRKTIDSLRRTKNQMGSRTPYTAPGGSHSYHTLHFHRPSWLLLYSQESHPR